MPFLLVGDRVDVAPAVDLAYPTALLEIHQLLRNRMGFGRVL